MKVAAGTLAFLSMTSVAFAQSADASAQAAINAGVLPPHPIQALRQEVKGMMQDEHAKAQQTRADFRAGVKADLQAASTSADKRAVLQDAREGRAAMQAGIKDERASVKADIKEKRAEIKADIKSRVQEFVRTHLNGALQRLNAATGMFDNVVSRIQSRIDKLKGKGVVTTSVETSLSSAMSAISVAKADTKALSDITASVNASSSPETVRSQMQAAIEKASASVKAAHKALIDTTAVLLSLVHSSANVQATTSTSSN